MPQLRMRKGWLSVLLTVVLVLTMLAPAAMARPAQGTVTYLVGFHAFPGQAERQLLRSYGAEITQEFSLIPTVVINLPAHLPQQAWDALARNPVIDYIEPNIEFHAIADSWGIDRVNAPAVWGQTTGQGVKVAILDTGIDGNHPNLNVWGGWNTLNNTSDYMDRQGHGTHVAGTVGALNVGRVVGVAPAARLYAVKVLGDDGSGTAASVATGIQWAANNGMNVINMSLGASSHSQTIQNACDAAYNQGLLLVAAAGNSGNRAGTGNNVNYPAAYASVIAVAATDTSNKRASFSSTGPAVEISAPGVSIISTYLNNGYASASGTSMASPHVAGVAALLWAYDGSLSNVALRQLLQQTATPLGNVNYYGYGLVNAAAAVAALEPPAPPQPAVQVTVAADKAAYVEGTDTEAVISVTVQDENGGAVTAGASLTTKLNNQVVSVAYTQTADGVYTGSLGLAGLAAGEYTVDVTVTDGRNVTGSGSASFTYSPAPSEPAGVSVTGISYSVPRNNKHLYVTVALSDDFGNPVAGASVAVTIVRAAGGSWSGSGTTGSNGTVTFTVSNAPSGTYSTTVNSVTAAGLSWDGLTPSNSYTK
jgi:subtilisin